MRGDLDDYTRWKSGIKKVIKFMSSAHKCPTKCAAQAHTRAPLAPTRLPPDQHSFLACVCVCALLACALRASPILKLQQAARKEKQAARKEKKKEEEKKRAKQAQRRSSFSRA